MHLEKWQEYFKPIQKTCDGANAGFNGTCFETYGAELQQVLSAPSNCVWTLLVCEGNLYISAGFHIVNRMGYFITGRPFSAKDEFRDIKVG